MKDEKEKKFFRIGENVQWKWLGNFILGTVEEIHFDRLEKTIKGKSIVRKGTKENPAYVVKSKVGNYALKLHSELGPIGTKMTGKKQKTSRVQPSLFSKKDDL
jgi:hypothetical protein